jgi:hypothetical protein
MVSLLASVFLIVTEHELDLYMTAQVEPPPPEGGGFLLQGFPNGTAPQALKPTFRRL